MEQKQRFFIYDRKEMGVLLFLGVMVAVFAFTLGVHLGKRVGPHFATGAPGDADTLPTVPDKIPNRQELTEQAKAAQQAADESLNQALHDEVARTGIKLDTARQVQLPEKPLAANAGATTGNPPPAAAVAAPEAPAAEAAPKVAEPKAPSLPVTAAPAVTEADAVALHRQVPAGKFTLQIGSYPALVEARDQADSLEALGLRPYMRQATVKGRQWFRLYLGGFETKDLAEKAGSGYVARHMIDAYIVSKKIDQPAATE